MRQVFSSQRIENVEGVAKLLSDAGIEVRITQPRSYKGNVRGTFRYTQPLAQQPAVWVVKADEQVRAREILRDNGLIDSTRPGESFLLPSVHDDRGQAGKTPAQQRLFRIKMALIGGIVVVLALAMLRGLQTTAPDGAVGTPAAAAFDGTPSATPADAGVAVLLSELDAARALVQCVAIDGRDPLPAVFDRLVQPGLALVPASQCLRTADEAVGSSHPASGREASIIEVNWFRQTGADTATIEFSAYHHRMSARYKTLELKRVDGRWQIARVLSHVAT